MHPAISVAGVRFFHPLRQTVVIITGPAGVALAARITWSTATVLHIINQLDYTWVMFRTLLDVVLVLVSMICVQHHTHLRSRVTLVTFGGEADAKEGEN